MTQDMPFNYTREDDINDELFKYLENILAENNITNLCPIPQNYDPTQRQVHGIASQVDFLVRWSLDVRETKYQFFIECKLLNCNGKNIEYINNGIRRFKNNRYAEHVPFAAMIGYIERGEVPTIIEDMNGKIRGTAVHEIVKTGQYYKSTHSRENGNNDIQIYHLFFDFRDCQNTPLEARPCRNNNMLLKSPI
jgi:hypothetical protein